MQGCQENVYSHSVRKTCISRMMDAEVPVDYLAQLSEHKDLKSLDSYKTASDKMSLVLSSGKKISPIFSNALLVKPEKQSLGVRAIQKARKKQALGEEQGLSGIFISSNIRSIKGC